jgi:hypothetical protein
MIADVRSRPCPVTQEINELSRLIVGDVGAGLSVWLDQCRAAFARLQECVLKHISFESQACFHKRLQAAAPGESLRIKALSSEHMRLLSESEALARALSIGKTPDSATIRDIIRRMENLVAHYRYHAACELDLAHRILGDSGDPATQRLCCRPCTHCANGSNCE